jgi:cellulose synthase/poly-beta-1,6-N-acetylglucosamine synthase-like glycosyltransferase
MPDTLAGSQSQNTRWESGRLQMARKYVPALLKTAIANIRQRKWRHVYILVDAVMEHLIPPFSLLIGMAAILFALDIFIYIATRSWSAKSPLTGTSLSANLASINLALGIFLLAAQVIYLFAGLSLVKAPGAIYRSFLFAPVFFAWKIGQTIRILFRKEQQDWVRTSRNQRV